MSFICRHYKIVTDVDGVVADVHVELEADVAHERLKLLFGFSPISINMNDLDKNDLDVDFAPGDSFQDL